MCRRSTYCIGLEGGTQTTANRRNEPVMNERIEALMEKLAQERDELKLKMHLAKSDARDEFDKLEGRWQSLKAKMDQASEEAAEVSEPIKESARDLMNEIRDGYRRIVDRF